MPRTTAIQACFNAGELSPDMSGRVDLALFAQGVNRMENLIPLVQGPAKRVPGTRYVLSSTATFLSQFQYSSAEAYVLQWGRNKCWFSTNGYILIDYINTITSASVYAGYLQAFLTVPAVNNFAVYDRVIMYNTGLSGLEYVGATIIAKSSGTLSVFLDTLSPITATITTGTLERVYAVDTPYTFSTPLTLSITAISKGTTTVVTLPASYPIPPVYSGPYGYIGTIDNVVGMTQLNGYRFGFYEIPWHSNQLGIIDLLTARVVDSTSFGTYVSGGTITIIPIAYSPWELGDYYGLRFAQSNNIVYIANAGLPPQMLARTSPTTFNLTPLLLSNGPFMDMDPDETRSVYVTLTTTNTIGAFATVTASAPVFKSTDIGRQIQLGAKNLSNLKPWAVATSYTAGNFIRSDGKTYVALNSATSGTYTPVHSEGALFDGPTGVQWQYRDAGLGWATIIGVTSSTFASIQIQSYLPDQCISSGNATCRWALGEFCSELGFPDFVTFFRERLVFARANDQKIWMSVTGDYQNFSRKDSSGSVTADMSIAVQVLSDQSNPIQWMMPVQALLVGTLGGEHFIQENNNQNPFGPDNITIKKITDNGGKYVHPCRLNNEILYVQEAGRQLIGCSYSWEAYGYVSRDLSLFANHMIQKKTAIVQLDKSRYPQLLIWVLDSAGSLYCVVLSKDQNVIGWSRIIPGGKDVFVRSIVTIPSNEKDRDELWMLVERTINGTVLRSLEQMQADWDTGDDQKDAWYVDSGLVREDSVTPFTTVDYLQHLEGETVNILADGVIHPQRVVVNGSITLAAPANKVIVGLPNQCKLVTLPLDRGQSEGTAQGKRKRLHHVTLRLINSLGGRTGTNANDLLPIIFRNTNSTMGTSVFFSGDIRLESPGGWDTSAQMWYINGDPVPTEIATIIPEAMVYEH